MTLTDLLIIAATGLGIAFLHAAIPTHWLPFVLTSKALKWSRSKTLTITALAGIGHVICTSALGFLLAWSGIALNDRIGAWFPRIAGGALLLLGLFYLYRQMAGSHGHFHLFGGHSHGHGAASDKAGPHGGYLVESHGTTIELSLHEAGGKSRFRLYQASAATGTALPAPEPASVALTLTRPDGAKETFSFSGDTSFLESVEAVAGPGPFTAILGIGHGDHEHEYSFAFTGHQDHAAPRDPTAAKSDWAAIGSLFMLLTFSPCEGFVAVYLSGVKYGWMGFALLTGILALGTVAAMVTFTWIALLGTQRIKVNALERYEGAILGSLLSLLGLFVILFDT